MAVWHGTNKSETKNGTDQDDQYYGYGGNDYLTGRLGNDLLDGGDGNDQLWGNGGHDILQGGAGRDLLHGSTGADQLYGGGGADTFRFTALYQSTSRPASEFGYDWLTDADLGMDTIWDFSSVEADKIDLNRIDANPNLDRDQAFTLIDVPPAYGTGTPGTAWIVNEGPGLAYVYLNSDADPEPEFTLLVLGSFTSLNSGDLLL